jgi:hypothetical protein
MLEVTSPMKRNIMFMLPVAFLCSASAFPLMLFERVKPYAPDPMRIAFDPGRSAYHNYKNVSTEYVRADSQWWSKFLAFVIVALAIFGVLT